MLNPITIVSSIAGVALVAYAGISVYSAGERNVQAKWDRAKLQWQKEKSDLQDTITNLERGLAQSIKEAQDANVAERKRNEEILQAQRARTDVALTGLRNADSELTKRLSAKPNDSAALTECKAIASAVQGLFDTCSRSYRELGEDAQRRLNEARSNGLECERSYDAAESALRKLGGQGKTP